MAVNFSKAFIDTVLLIGSIETGAQIDEHLRSILLEFQRDWPRRPIEKLGLYSEGQISHHVYLKLSVPRRGPHSLRLTLQIHVIPPGERIRASTQLKEKDAFAAILRILDTVGRRVLRHELHAHVDWVFPTDTFQTVISLPLLSMSDPNLPFSDLVGVRFRKVSKAGEVSIILDLQRDRSLNVAVRFPFTEPISSAVPDRIVEQGTKLLGGFVTEPERGENHGNSSR